MPLCSWVSFNFTKGLKGKDHKGKKLEDEKEVNCERGRPQGIPTCTIISSSLMKKFYCQQPTFCAQIAD